MGGAAISAPAPRADIDFCDRTEQLAPLAKPKATPKTMPRERRRLPLVAVGLMLAQAEPDRATEILTRARAYGESRVVCGVHNASAIEAGRTNGAAVVAALNGDPAFRADIAAVAKEIARLRAAGAQSAQACAAEAALTATTPW